LLEKLDRKTEADSIMKKAYPMATMLQLNAYARSLMRQKKHKEAFDVYKMNYDKYPDDIYTRLGMIRGYAALGNTKEALKYADKAMAISTDTNTKAYVEKMIADVKAGKDISY
jgi:tetratricopeptide (TPR) repeat protein